MATYVICYDLRNKKNYEALYDAIKSYGTWARILESTWAVKTEDSATEIRDKLAEVMDADDGLLVVKSAGVAAWRNVDCKSQWLKDYI